jgi:hypothetical protein
LGVFAIAENKRITMTGRVIRTDGVWNKVCYCSNSPGGRLWADRDDWSGSGDKSLYKILSCFLDEIVKLVM